MFLLENISGEEPPLFLLWISLYLIFFGECTHATIFGEDSVYLYVLQFFFVVQGLFFIILSLSPVGGAAEERGISRSLELRLETPSAAGHTQVRHLSVSLNIIYGLNIGVFVLLRLK